MTRTTPPPFTPTRGRTVIHPRRLWDASLARDEAERERRALAELRARARGEATPSASVVSTWVCRSAACATAGADPWTRPSRSRDGASCHRCGAPRPTPTP